MCNKCPECGCDEYCAECGTCIACTFDAYHYEHHLRTEAQNTIKELQAMNAKLIIRNKDLSEQIEYLTKRKK